MAHEYRYPLTRVCLRGGNMTLPRTMIGLFPDDGAVTIVDSVTGQEHAAYMSGPRVVSGLGDLYREHGLDVNDELLVSQLDESRFGVTALVRADADTESEAADVAVQAEPSTPAGEDEVQPAGGLEPSGQEATDQETSDHETSADEASAARVDGSSVEGTADYPGQSSGGSSSGHAAGYAGEHAAEHAADSSYESAEAPEAASHERTSLDPRLAVREAESALSELESEGFRVADPEQASLWDGGGQATSDEPEATAFAGPPSAAAEAPPSAEPATPKIAAAAPPTPASATARQARGPAYTDAEDDAAALAAVALSSRLRRAFTRLGYRIEPLATGVLFLHAEMGRRRYKVLVQLLRSGERLDWAGLLSRRRNSPADYLAVVGDGADLLRLSHPAELARATLWSWEALERLEELHASVPVTPLDLESHFARDGLFEQGLKRFEEGIAARVAERGAASEVLTRLARNRAPSVFLLEELAQDVNLSRDLVLRILDRFSEAPMHLVARVDSGEFLLRQPVDTALAALASYAESLRQRLPVGRREVITGLDDGDFGADLLGDEPSPQAPPHAEPADRQAADQ